MNFMAFFPGDLNLPNQRKMAGLLQLEISGRNPKRERGTGRMSHCGDVSPSLVSDQGTHFTAKERSEGPTLMEFTVLTMFPMSQSSGLIECWNVVLKTQLQHQPGVSTLQDGVKVLHQAEYAVNQCLTCGANHEPRSGNGSGTIIINPNDSLAKLLLPVPAILCSADLKILILRGATLPPGRTMMIPLNWKVRLWPPPTLGSTCP